MIPLPTTPIEVLAQVVRPALLVLPAKMRGDASTVLMLAIGGQESGYQTRAQYGGGPAHSFWQMEEGGGVKGVMTHPASAPTAMVVCRQYGVAFDTHSVWVAMGSNDALGACFARLLLWTDTGPMPSVGDVDAGWDYYDRLWRPGKPGPDRWPANYAAALEAFRS